MKITYDVTQLITYLSEKQPILVVLAIVTTSIWALVFSIKTMPFITELEPTLYLILIAFSIFLLVAIGCITIWAIIKRH